MLFIASAVCETAWPPCMASLAAWVAMPSVTVALSAFCLTEALICCSAAVVSSTPAACCEADWASDCEVCETCSLAEPSCPAAERTSAKVVLTVSISWLNLPHSSAWKAALSCSAMRWVKSPCIEASTAWWISSAVRCAASCSLWVLARRSSSTCLRFSSLTCIAPSEASTLCAAAWAAPCTGLRSPSATRCAALPSTAGSAPNWRRTLRGINQASKPPASNDTANAVNITVTKRPASASACWLAAWMRRS